MKTNPTQLSESPITGDARRKSTWSLVFKGFVAAIVVLLILGLTAPTVIHCPKRPDQTEAVNNARQIGLALFEFETEYGKLPDVSMVAAVQTKTSTRLNLGTKSSNDFFRQLPASGVVQSKAMLYLQSAGTRKPANFYQGRRRRIFQNLTFLATASRSAKVL